MKNSNQIAHLHQIIKKKEYEAQAHRLQHRVGDDRYMMGHVGAVNAIANVEV
jgi:hypothetical protein